MGHPINRPGANRNGSARFSRLLSGRAPATARIKSSCVPSRAGRGVANGGVAHAKIRQLAPERFRQWQRVGHVQAPGMHERLHLLVSDSFGTS